jgi:hypothetical protein
MYRGESFMVLVFFSFLPSQETFDPSQVSVFLISLRIISSRINNHDEETYSALLHVSFEEKRGTVSSLGKDEKD